ncbi:hypothetical protein B296_00030339 [Ensete ventricosum]|uniref:Uncharacterized protein n=1 Tax=Ensete ventricosum TaxID=4639 RepID=A0A426Z1F9_ENSVE|nr:hypothetical protein B296_00030339 [Ensete ventricosum]
MCISVDALEAGLRFPLHPLIEECLRWWRSVGSQPGSAQFVALSCRLFGRVSRGRDYPDSGLIHGVFSPLQESRWLLPHRPSQFSIWGFRLYWSAHPIDNASPYLSEEETVLVGRLKGLSSSRVIKEMAELWLVKADRMDLGELRGMPKVTNDKVPSTRPTAREVGASPVREAPKASLKRPVVTPTEQAEDAARHHKKVKVLTRRHKSRLGEGESHSRSKGKELAAPSKEPEAPVESEEGGASLAHQRPRSMKDLFKTKVHKGDTSNYALLMSDLGHQDPEKEMKARWKGLKNSTKVWYNSSAAEFERGLLHPQLARELYTLPSEVLMARVAKEIILQLQEELDALKSNGGPEAVAKAEEHASELQEELEKTKRERGEELLRHEASEKELHEVVKALESARAELPMQSVVQYKESLSFKEGMKRMGRLTYEYGYQVALARFCARHSDVEVEEDPFTIHPEDDLVPMERQQAFDDSVPPEP